MRFSTRIAKPLQLALRVMQWGSAIIVLGLTSWFISKGPRGQHIIYQEVIVRGYTYRAPDISISALTSLGRLLGCLLYSSIHLPLPPIILKQNGHPGRYRVLLPVRCLALPCNSIQSLTPLGRWLTAFIFAAQDYNWHSCYFDSPPGVSCRRKRANEAFIFLALYVHFHVSFWSHSLQSVPALSKIF